MLDGLKITEKYNNSKEAKAVQVKVYESFEELRDIREEWNKFVERNGADIFITYDWCRIWWKYYGGKRNLHILILRDENDIVAILPFFTECIRVFIWKISIIKLVGADYSIFQFSLPIIEKCRKEIFLTALSYLKENVKFDVMVVGPLSGVFDIERLIGNDCLQLGFKFVPVVYYPQTYFYPKKDYEDYISLLTRKERRNMRKSYRYMESISADGIAVEKVNIDNFNIIFDEFVDLHQDYWRCLGKLGHFGDWPKSKEFHKELAQCELGDGSLRLYKFTVGDEVMGYDYGYKFGDVYYDFLNSRSNSSRFKGHSLGKIIIYEILKEASNEGVKLVDSMRCSYPYKLKLGGVMRDSNILQFYQNTVISKMLYNIMRIYAKMIDLLYYKIWFCRLSSKIFPVSWRKPLNIVWIKTNIFS